MGWFRSNGVTLEEVTSYSPELNLIEQIWLLMKAILHKYYAKVCLRKWPKKEIRNTFKEVVTFCWNLEIFDSLTKFRV